MKIGIKKRSAFGVKRIALEGKIEKIEKKASASDPGKQSLVVFFKGLEGLGVINLSPKEVEMLVEKAKTEKKVESVKEEASTKTVKKKIKKKVKKKVKKK